MLWCWELCWCLAVHWWLLMLSNILMGITPLWHFIFFRFRKWDWNVVEMTLNNRIRHLSNTYEILASANLNFWPDSYWCVPLEGLQVGYRSTQPKTEPKYCLHAYFNWAIYRAFDTRVISGHAFCFSIKQAIEAGEVKVNHSICYLVIDMIIF